MEFERGKVALSSYCKGSLFAHQVSVHNTKVQLSVTTKQVHVKVEILNIVGHSEHVGLVFLTNSDAHLSDQDKNIL